MSLGTGEIILIVVAILLLFGAKRIPELARAFGRARNEYDKAKNELKRESDEFMAASQEAAAREESAPKDKEPDSGR